MREHRSAWLAHAGAATFYGVAALALVAVYRQPLAALAKDVAAWYNPLHIRSVRDWGGRLGRDINEALDNA